MKYTDKDLTREQIIQNLMAYGFSRDSIRHLSTEGLRKVLDCHEPVRGGDK